MKRIIIFITSFLFCALLCGCHESGSNSASSNPSPPPPPSSGGTFDNATYDNSIYG